MRTKISSLAGLGLFAAGALLLSGCDGVDTAQYKSVIESTVAARSGGAICLTIYKEQLFYPYEIAQSSNGETAIPLLAPETKLQLEKTFSLFVQLGLMEKKDIIFSNSPEDKNIVLTRYTISSTGKNFFQQKRNAFCFGDVSINEMKYAQPVKEMLGGAEIGKGTEIYYTWTLSNAPAWAHDPALAKYYGKNFDFTKKRNKSFVIINATYKSANEPADYRDYFPETIEPAI